MHIYKDINLSKWNAASLNHIMEAIQIRSDPNALIPCRVSWLFYLRMLQFALAATIMSLAAFSCSRLKDLSWEVIYTVVAV